MRPSKAIALFFALAALGWASDSSARLWTVGVDPKTGKLVRVLAGRRGRSENLTTPASGSAPVNFRAASQAVNRRWLDKLIEQVSERHQIHSAFVHAIINTESNYDPFAVSPKGAQGLMQLMPQTARRFGVSNISDPAENLEGGVRYLRRLLDRYQDPRLSLAAYNAGEGAVERYAGVPPYPETRQFIHRVASLYPSFQDIVLPAWPDPAPKKLAGPRIYRVLDASGITRYVTGVE